MSDEPIISVTEIDARMSALAQQRDNFANQVVIMAGTIAALRKQIEELTTERRDEKSLRSV